MHRSKATFREFLVAAVANISAIGMGTALGWPSPMFANLLSNSTLENPVGYPIVEAEQSWINSILAVGGFFGPFAAGYLADWKGRRLALLLSGPLHLIGWILLVVAKSVAVMIVGRFVLGFGNGWILIALTMYIGEIASDKYRGILGSFLQIGQTLGILYVYCIGPFVSYFVCQWICLAVTILFTVLFYYMPETPHFYVANNLDYKATEVLMYLRDGHSVEDVEQEKELIKKHLHQEQDHQKSNVLRSLFTNRANLRALIISFFLLSFQQWTGIDCILSNSELIFDEANISLAPEISTIMLGIVQVVSCLLTLLFVDRVGRKPVLMSSALGLTVSLGILGAYFMMVQMNDVPQHNISWMPLTGMLAFIAIFNFGFGPVPWAIASEIFAHDVKAVGNMINISVTWILDFLALRFFLLIGETFGLQWSFWIFAIVCAAAFVFTLLCVIETKGLSLQEIQERLGSTKKKPDQ
ncbi:facilitated trehalose transporter Tret1-like [Uranotaenia lowii]|uniref:facilitated trehalose transporter Tret1-like n=1 Tax=Uranotaenia lowii TaxID=190385 RepID=UPI002478CF9B|nr:facilitated trehalose transporter Tret1-like [Uranotaenia lowii]